MNLSEITLPSKKYKRKATVFSIAIFVVAIACFYMGFNPFGFFTEFHFVRDLLGEMFPPNFNALWSSSSVGYSFLQTMSMAFLGTLYGSLIAIVIAFLAATNTMPLKTVRMCAKFSLSLLRVVPALVVVLIFVIAVGIGSFAGVLTLVVITIGTFGKLFTEIIENTEVPPSEAIFSVGASQVQVIRYSVIPQILPSFIANLLYAFDVNVRAAIGLGIFGGGGIGFELYLSMRVLHYKDAMAYIFFIIVLVILVEKISNYLRMRLLNEGSLK
ncbi:MAG: phosphonate ABC transporter, permease protein PhnE [Cyclobacteriaceae bacterium]